MCAGGIYAYVAVYTYVLLIYTCVHTYMNLVHVGVSCFHMLVHIARARVCASIEMECVLFYSRKIADQASVIHVNSCSMFISRFLCKPCDYKVILCIFILY